MLITETTRTIVQVASASVGVVGAVGTVAAIRDRVRSSAKLPVAIVKRSRLRGVLRSLSIVALVLGIAGFMWAGAHDIKVLLVRDGHSVYGELAFDERLASSLGDFDVVEMHEGAMLQVMSCWAVNTSSKPLRVVQIQYPDRYRHFVETSSFTVPPGQRVHDCRFDYFGPDFAPPDTVQAMANASPATGFATWLTWSVGETRP